MRVAEVDRHLGRQGDLSVLGQLGSLIPGQGLSQPLGEGFDGCQQAITNGDRGAVAGEVDQHGEPGLTSHQSRYRGPAVRPQDQVTLPMTGNSTVSHLRRPLADHDHDHVRDLARVLRGRSFLTSDGTAGAQVLMQVSSQVATALNIACLVDPLGTHPHLLPVRKYHRQMITDLLRTPFHTQLRLHQGCQFR